MSIFWSIALSPKIKMRVPYIGHNFGRPNNEKIGHNTRIRQQIMYVGEALSARFYVMIVLLEYATLYTSNAIHAWSLCYVCSLYWNS